MKRTPWFSAHKHSPVRAGIYEWRCHWATDGISRAVYHRLHGWNVPFMSVSVRPSTVCSFCEWRGLTKEQK